MQAQMNSKKHRITIETATPLLFATQASGARLEGTKETSRVKG